MKIRKEMDSKRRGIDKVLKCGSGKIRRKEKEETERGKGKTLVIEKRVENRHTKIRREKKNTKKNWGSN